MAIERMNTAGSVAWSCIRTRSPRMAPPVNGEDGSTASTATWSTGPAIGSPAPTSSVSRCPDGTGGQPVRAVVISRSVRVDLPAPGAPVKPDRVGRRPR